MRALRDYSLIALAGCLVVRLAALLVAPALPLLALTAAVATVGTWDTRRR